MADRQTNGLPDGAELRQDSAKAKGREADGHEADGHEADWHEAELSLTAKRGYNVPPLKGLSDGVGENVPAPSRRKSSIGVADIAALTGCDFAKVLKKRVGDDTPNLKRWYDAVSARPSAKA